MIQEEKLEYEKKLKELTRKVQETQDSLEQMRESMATTNQVNVFNGFDKFKNMVAYSFENFTKKYGFKNGTVDWKDLAHKVELEVVIKTTESKELYKQLIKSLSKISEESGVAFKILKAKTQDVMTSIEDIKEKLYLLGNKNSINKLNKEFKDILNTLGFEANDLFYNTVKHDFIDTSKVRENIDKEFEQLQFVKSNGRYNNAFIKNLDPEGKIRTFYTALWPALAKKIKEGMSLTTEIDVFKKSNKYLRLLEEFSIKNKMSVEDVANILKVDANAFEEKHLLYKTIGADKIKDNYANIVENINKFSILIGNIHALMNGLIDVTEDMKFVISNTNLSEEQKNNFFKTVDETKIFKDKTGYIFTYEKVKQNMSYTKWENEIQVDTDIDPTFENNDNVQENTQRHPKLKL